MQIKYSYIYTDTHITNNYNLTSYKNKNNKATKLYKTNNYHTTTTKKQCNNVKQKKQNNKTKNQQIQCSELQYCMSKGIHAHTDEMACVNTIRQSQRMVINSTIE